MSGLTAESDQMGFQATLQRAIAGSQDDIRRLIDEYGHCIQRVVRRRLDTRLRSKFDSIDFVQMVWASFFRDAARLERFGTPEEFVRFLVTMARNKVVDEERRRLMGARYNCSHDTSYDESENPAGTASGATPSQFAIAREELEKMVATESDRDREVIRLRISGASFVEISKALGINERTARRVIRRLAGHKDEDAVESDTR
jgi:RNA polymerase sigma factor (sigma-70 family)